MKLHTPKRYAKDWAAVRTAFRHYCQLVVNDANGAEIFTQTLKPDWAYNEYGVNLSIKFGSMELAPDIEIKATITSRKVHSMDSDVLHEGYIRFAFGVLLQAEHNLTGGITDSYT